MTRINHALRNNLDILLSKLPAVRSGDADAIHDARVATRRLRAMLPVAAATQSADEWTTAGKVIRRLGRALGRARDVDVAVEQLDGAELRVAPAARAIARLRLALVGEQEKAQRRLIKRLERLDLEALRSPRHARVWRLSLRADPAERALSDAIADAADRVRSDVDAAGGVYFPNRLHRARVAVKKLRYLLDVLPDSETGRRLRKQLRRAQETLGALRDRHTLLDFVDRIHEPGTLDDEHDALQAWLKADMRELHGEYLKRRDTLTEAAKSLSARFAPRDGRLRKAGWWTVGAIAGPSAALLLVRGRQPERPTPAIPREAPSPAVPVAAAPEVLTRLG